MKKSFKVTAILFFALLIYACSTEENLKPSEESFLSQVIEDKDLNNISSNYQDAIFLEGKFKIIRPGNNQLALYTETRDSKHIFLFNEVDESYVLNKNIEKLAYLKNGILLNDDLFLGVEGNISNTMNKDLKILSKANTLERHENFKVLIHKWYSKDDSNYKSVSPEALISNSNKMAFLHEGDCDAGGEGSSGCSIGGGSTGCSVSCGSGYHACCNVTLMGANDCHCDKN